MCDKKKKKNPKKLSQFLKSHISGTLEAISLKFGMLIAAVGGHVHSKNRFVSSRKHRATEVRKLRFLSSCQYTHGCYAPASWAARHTTVCPNLIKNSKAVRKVRPLKSHGEKRCEIQGGGQEMAVMVG